MRSVCYLTRYIPIVSFGVCSLLVVARVCFVCWLVGWRALFVCVLTVVVWLLLFVCLSLVMWLYVGVLVYCVGKCVCSLFVVCWVLLVVCWLLCVLCLFVVVVGSWLVVGGWWLVVACCSCCRVLLLVCCVSLRVC